MISLLTGFVAELREVGIPVSMVEAIDAGEALAHVSLDDRQALRHSLAACLVKNEHHLDAFNAAFDVYFSPLPPIQASAQPTEDGAEHASAGVGAGGGARAADPALCTP